MTEHPSGVQLKQLLSEQLEINERQAIAAHVDGCSECQETLTSLKEEAEIVRWRQRFAQAAPLSGEPTAIAGLKAPLPSYLESPFSPQPTLPPPLLAERFAGIAANLQRGGGNPEGDRPRPLPVGKTGGPFALDHAISLRQSAFDVALVDRDPLEGQRRLLGVVVRCGRLVIDVNRGIGQSVTVRMREEDYGLGNMTDRALGQTRLVLVYQRDEIFTGYVAVIDDGGSIAVELVANVRDPPCRNAGSTAK